MADGTCVYVIGGKCGPQKIGVASDAAQRRLYLQRSSAVELAVHAAFPLPRALAFAVEQAAHRALAPRRMRGEWFDIEPETARGVISAAIDEVQERDAARNSPIGKAVPWQKRAKLAGLSQKALAHLLGVAENTVSQQLRGKWQSGTPQYVKTVILAWERLSPAAREELLNLIDKP